MKENEQLKQLRAAKDKGRQNLLGTLRASKAQKQAETKLRTGIKPFGSGGIAADVAKANKKRGR